MAYEMVMPYHLHMPSYFLETFTEYPYGSCTVNGYMSILMHGYCTPSSAKPIGPSFSTIRTAFNSTYLAVTGLK